MAARFSSSTDKWSKDGFGTGLLTKAACFVFTPELRYRLALYDQAHTSHPTCITIPYAFTKTIPYVGLILKPPKVYISL
jgi:hypothetical protein